MFSDAHAVALLNAESVGSMREDAGQTIGAGKKSTDETGAKKKKKYSSTLVIAFVIAVAGLWAFSEYRAAQTATPPPPLQAASETDDAAEAKQVMASQKRALSGALLTKVTSFDISPEGMVRLYLSGVLAKVGDHIADSFHVSGTGLVAGQTIDSSSFYAAFANSDGEEVLKKTEPLNSLGIEYLFDGIRIGGPAGKVYFPGDEIANGFLFDSTKEDVAAVTFSFLINGGSVTQVVPVEKIK